MRAISTTCKHRTALLYTPPQSHGSIVRIPCRRSRYMYIREEKQERCVWKGHGSRKRTGFTFARSAWALPGTRNVTYIPTYIHTYIHTHPSFESAISCLALRRSAIIYSCYNMCTAYTLVIRSGSVRHTCQNVNMIYDMCCRTNQIQTPHNVASPVYLHGLLWCQRPLVLLMANQIETVLYPVFWYHLFDQPCTLYVTTYIA